MFKAKTMNEVDAGRDRATPASVRHDVRREGGREKRRKAKGEKAREEEKEGTRGRTGGGGKRERERNRERGGY